MTNTQRLLQWHDKALDPPGDCRSDAWFVYNLGKRLKELYAGSTDPATSRCWTSPGTTTSTSPAAARRHARAASRASRTSRRSCRRSTATGWTRSTRAPAGRGCVSGFSELKDDGTTACGCWIYSGVFPEPGRNRARERKRDRQPAAARVGLRLAAQPPRPVQPRLGRPRGPAVVGAEEAHLVGRESRRWVGHDEPDFEPDKPPDYQPPPGATGMARHRRATSRSS